MSYARLASGRTDLACDTGFQVYDFAAMRPVIEGAGGVITDWEGRPLTLESGRRLVASGSHEVHQAALKLIANASLQHMKCREDAP